MPPSASDALDALQQSADLLAQQRPRAARNLLADLLAEAPLHVTAQMLLANACEATGDLEAALAAWHQAFFLVPTSPVVQRERQRLAEMLAEEATSALPRPTVPPLPHREVSLPPVETDALPFDVEEAGAPKAPDAADIFAIEDLLAIAEPEPDGDLAYEPRPFGLDMDDDPGAPGDSAAAVQKSDEATSAAEASVGAEETGEPHEAESALDFDNLDTLIEQLEQAPRIVPDPDFEVPDAPPATDDAIADDMVSETLAKIFVSQNRIDEAIEVYETLAEREPHRRSEWLTRAEEVRRAHDRADDDHGGSTEGG